jgi:hypothetical protein
VGINIYSKTFVEFVFRVYSFNKYELHEIPSRNIAHVKIPNKALGYRFFDFVNESDKSYRKNVSLWCIL